MVSFPGFPSPLVIVCSKAYTRNFQSQGFKRRRLCQNRQRARTFTTSPIAAVSEATAVEPLPSNSAWTNTGYTPGFDEHEKSRSLYGWTAIKREIYRQNRLANEHPYNLGFPVFQSPRVAPSMRQTVRRPMAERDLKRSIEDAMSLNDPYQLMCAMLQTRRHPKVLRELTSEQFTKVLHNLSPQHFIKPYEGSRPHFWERLSDQRRTPRLKQKFYRYMFALLSQAHHRRLAGENICLEDYQLLLEAAAAGRSSRTASHIWIAMLEEKHEPSLACYNALFEALCVDDLHKSKEQRNLRLIPTNIARFRISDAPTSGYKFGRGGLRETVTYWFNHMCNQGIHPNAETYGWLMVALAREQDLKEVYRLIRGTWDIDLEDLPNSEERYPSTKPLIDPYCNPTPSTLKHLMHAMCVNNSLPEAMRAVERMSKAFSLAITDETWEVLIEWTAIHSINRTSKRIENWQGQGIGQVKNIMLRETWNVIRQEPFNVNASLQMLNHFCSNAARRGNLTEVLGYVRQGVKIYRARLKAYMKALETQAQSLLHEPTTFKSPSTITPSRFQLHHTTLSARLLEHQAFDLLRRWFVLIVRNPHFMRQYKAVQIVEWHRIALPTTIQELWHFRPLGLHYEPCGNLVEFEEKESTLREWEDLQMALERVTPETDAKVGEVVERVKMKLEACQRRGIDEFVEEVLGPEVVVRESAVSKTEVQTEEPANTAASSEPSWSMPVLA